MKENGGTTQEGSQGGGEGGEGSRPIERRATDSRLRSKKLRKGEWIFPCREDAKKNFTPRTNVGGEETPVDFSPGADREISQDLQESLNWDQKRSASLEVLQGEKGGRQIRRRRGNKKSKKSHTKTIKGRKKNGAGCERKRKAFSTTKPEHKRSGEDPLEKSNGAQEKEKE